MLKRADMNIPGSKNHQIYEGYVINTQKRRTIYNKQKRKKVKIQWQIEDAVRDVVETHPERASTLFHYKTSTIPPLSLLLSLSLSLLRFPSPTFFFRPSSIVHRRQSIHVQPSTTLHTQSLNHAHSITMYLHPAAHQDLENPLGLPIYECWFCPTNWIGFSGLLYHLEEGRCVKRDRIRTLAFETPEYGFYGNKLTDENPFFCFQCRTQFPQVSHLYHHVEQNPSCSYLLNPSECLGALRDFYIEYYECPGSDYVSY